MGQSPAAATDLSVCEKANRFELNPIRALKEFSRMSISSSAAFAVSLIFASVFAAGTALAQDWKHASVKSSEGITLKIECTTNKDGFNGCYKCIVYTRTDALWLNVEAPGQAPI